jgi:hypothetical protein
MGEGSEGTPACSENNWPGSCKAHHFVSRTQEDRSGAKSAVGEAEGGAEESGVNTHKARCFGGGLFSLMRKHNDLPDGLGNTCDRARLHCHTGSLLRKLAAPCLTNALKTSRQAFAPTVNFDARNCDAGTSVCRILRHNKTPRLSSIGRVVGNRGTEIEI